MVLGMGPDTASAIGMTSSQYNRSIGRTKTYGENCSLRHDALRALPPNRKRLPQTTWHAIKSRTDRCLRTCLACNDVAAFGTVITSLVSLSVCAGFRVQCNSHCVRSLYFLWLIRQIAEYDTTCESIHYVQRTVCLCCGFREVLTDAP